MTKKQTDEAVRNKVKPDGDLTEGKGGVGVGNLADSVAL